MRSLALWSHVGVLVVLLAPVRAHSWPEALNVIDAQGTIAGSTGYVRNFIPRTAPGFKGDQTDSFQKTQVVAGAKVCMDRETTQTQSSGYPRLAVTPGAKVALRYAENGHVTIEEAGRPAEGGPVYIFGTTDSTTNPLITDVMQWNGQGSGGNKAGKLITTQNFDDGRCYENNNSPKAQERKAISPLDGALALPDFSGLPCQNDFIVPMDAPVGKPYTVYWVWNFTFTDPPNRGVEIFSNCLDLDVQAPSNAPQGKSQVLGPQQFDLQQPPISAAVQSYFANLVADPLGAGANSAPTGAQTPQASDAVPSSSPVVAPSPTAALLSEGLNGGVYASQISPTPAPEISTPAAIPTPSITTVYVTLMPPGYALPTVSMPGVGSESFESTPGTPGLPKSQTAVVAPSAITAASAMEPSTPPQTQSIPVISYLSSTPSEITSQPNSAAQYTSQSLAPQSASQASVEPSTQPQSANGLNIPLLSIGTSGINRVTPAPSVMALPSPSAAPMHSDEPCKKKRAGLVTSTHPKGDAMRFRRRFH